MESRSEKIHMTSCPSSGGENKKRPDFVSTAGTRHEGKGESVSRVDTFSLQ